MEKKKQRFLFLIENYNLFYSRYYENHPSIHNKDYQEQLSELLGTHYYHSDSYASAFEKKGFVAATIIPDCNPLQLTWLRENNYPLYLRWKAGTLSRSFQARVLKNYNTYQEIQMQTLKAQIAAFKPDVIFVYSGVNVSRAVLEMCKEKNIRLILNWSTFILPGLPYDCYDFVISSARQLKDEFAELGVRCLEFQQAFDDRILQTLGPAPSREIDVAFVGNINEDSSLRIRILEELAEKSDIMIWGSGTESLRRDSPILKKHHGRTGGVDMFNIYRKSKIALHIHNDGHSDYAGAKRYFEVTGAGTMLMAFHQANITEYFKIGEEIVTFESGEDCLQKIRYYLEHEDERERISLAGQKRTLQEHTFTRRTGDLIAEIEKLD
jgi:spore maturation protein CgeB